MFRLRLMHAVTDRPFTRNTNTQSDTKGEGEVEVNILGYMQKVGRALMVPVATLPAAAILMGIGYWIDPVAWGA